MDKREFLDILRQSLEGEVDNNTLEQSIRFYNEYISSQEDKSEEEVINDIGNPRLIAKTIIETEKMSNKTDSSSWNYNDSQSNRRYYDDNAKDRDYNTSNNREIFPRIKWYHKLVFIFILLLLLYLLIKIGWIFIRLFSFFLVPIIIIALLLVMFRDWNIYP